MNISYNIKLNKGSYMLLIPIYKKNKQSSKEKDLVYTKSYNLNSYYHNSSCYLLKKHDIFEEKHPILYT